MKPRNSHDALDTKSSAGAGAFSVLDAHDSAAATNPRRSSLTSMQEVTGHV
jgi:hypothetical protein